VRTVIVAATLLAVVGVGVYGQQGIPGDTVSLSLIGDSIDRRPVNGYDGIIRTGPAEDVMTVTGNVVVIINGVRIKSDTAVWHPAANAIDIGRGGAARIDLPGRVSSLRICASAGADKCRQ
jgi:hypothetical protein